MDDRDTLIAEQQAEIAELKRRMERQQVHASILGADTIRKYDEAMEGLQLERDAYKEQIAGLQQLFHFFIPRVFYSNRDLLPESIQGDVKRFIGLNAVVFNGETNERATIKIESPYPGTMEQARAELEDRLLAVIRRAPQPDRLVHRGLPVGYDDVYFEAIARVSPYWYMPDLRSQFEEMRGQIFAEVVWPAIKDDAMFQNGDNQAEAKRRFVKMLGDNLKGS